MPSSVTRIVMKFLFFALLLVALAEVFGWTAAWGAGCLIATTAWVYGSSRLHRLHRWLGGDPRTRVPQGLGLWDDTFSLLYRQQRAQHYQISRLTEALTSFRRAAQAMPDGVVTLTHEFHIVWCNGNAAALFGLDAHADSGRPITNLVRNPEFQAYIDSRDWQRPVVFRTVRTEPRVVSVQLIEYGEGQILLMARDITQFDRLETMRRDFVANVSHELKTPLTVLAGFLETLRDHDADMPDAQRAHCLALMDEQATRMRRIVEDLLTLSALEGAPLAPRDHVVALDPLFERIDNAARSLSAGRHTLIFECERGAALLGHDTELGSAFENLVSNAIRYTPEGGQIRVAFSIDRSGDAPTAHFWVKDTGIGIEASHIPRLTERFYRVDRGRSRESGGTGLGLAIVKHVLARHEASLHIDSTVGVGTTMRVDFPARRIAPQSNLNPT